MSQLTIHLIANAHLDPVWLWDWQEGLNEGIITCRAILDLMDENPELTFIRGEAAIYQHIEEHDPETFARIESYVREGRWDIVGGTYVQPDTNLPATETFARHFARSQNYFQSRFGKVARIAWAADSFGHSAGLPEILAAAGMEGYAFSRPFASELTLPRCAFWWEGPGGSRVLAYRVPVGWYGSEREELLGKLDSTLAYAAQDDTENIACFYGVGNHGGGPTRRHLAEIREWAERHPEVRVVHSGLHRFFDTLREEGARKREDFFPTHRGELNFCLRGCYASVAQFKYAYRKTEAALAGAERTNSVISAALDKTPAPLNASWDALLFNSFHDILPGSSIERAFDQQLAWMGTARHEGKRAELAALNALAMRVDTRVPKPAPDMPSASTLLVWNPHPHAYHGPLELEASLDYRPIWKYSNRVNDVPVEVRDAGGKSVPFQMVATEHNSMPTLAWRKRVVVNAELPPLGWSLFTLGYVEGAEVAAGDAASAVTAPSTGVIDNGHYRVEAQAGSKSVQVYHNGQSIFGDAGLSAVTVSDPWGSWGAMDEDPAALDLSNVLTEWSIDRVETLETGPERAALWVRLAGGLSQLELTFFLYRNRDAVDVRARVHWNERQSRLKLVMPAGDRAEFDVPGGSIERPPLGEVPGGRWVRVHGTQGDFGFASDALYNFDCKDGIFRATVARAGGWATDVTGEQDVSPWRPPADTGSLRFNFILAPGGADLPRLSRELEETPLAILAPAKNGDLARSGSFASLSPETLKVLALKPAEDGNGWILRVQELSGTATEPQFEWLGERLYLGTVQPNRIATWRIVHRIGGWGVTAVDIQERDISGS